MIYFVLLVHVVMGYGLDPTIFYIASGLFIWLMKLPASGTKGLASPYIRNKMMGSYLSDFFP